MYVSIKQLCLVRRESDGKQKSFLRSAFKDVQQINIHITTDNYIAYLIKKEEEEYNVIIFKFLLHIYSINHKSKSKFLVNEELP